MKRNEIRLNFVIVDGKATQGKAIVIGTRAKHAPYINIENQAGQVVVSLDHKEVSRIIKKWVKAWGGYPP